MFTVEVTQESERTLAIKIDTAKRDLHVGVRRGINAAAIHLATVIKRDYLSGQVVNRRTGNLSRAVFSKMESDTVGVVGVGREAPYGRFVNDGTRPHVIEAVNAKALRFAIGGDFIFRRKVNHPGTKATHFMESALAAARVDIERIIGEQIHRSVKGQPE